MKNSKLQIAIAKLTSVARLVAQVCNLLYRRFAIGRPSKTSSPAAFRTPCRLQTCDTADSKSALRGNPFCGRLNAFNLLTFLTLLALSTINSQLSTLLAQGSAFTYQGRLNDGASPANGLYDL